MMMRLMRLGLHSSRAAGKASISPFQSNFRDRILMRPAFIISESQALNLTSHYPTFQLTARFSMRFVGAALLKWDNALDLTLLLRMTCLQCGVLTLTHRLPRLVSGCGRGSINYLGTRTGILASLSLHASKLRHFAFILFWDLKLCIFVRLAHATPPLPFTHLHI